MKQYMSPQLGNMKAANECENTNEQRSTWSLLRFEVLTTLCTHTIQCAYTIRLPDTTAGLHQYTALSGMGVTGLEVTGLPAKASGWALLDLQVFQPMLVPTRGVLT